MVGRCWDIGLSSALAVQTNPSRIRPIFIMMWVRVMPLGGVSYRAGICVMWHRGRRKQTTSCTSGSRPPDMILLQHQGICPMLWSTNLATRPWLDGVSLAKSSPTLSSMSSKQNNDTRYLFQMMTQASCDNFTGSISETRDICSYNNARGAYWFECGTVSLSWCVKVHEETSHGIFTLICLFFE